MVIVNVHVFDFLIHLSKFSFCNISYEYLVIFKKKIKPGLLKKHVFLTFFFLKK